MTYKLYCLDGNGECTDVQRLSAKDDAHAIEQVELMQPSAQCELWQRGRFVTMLPAYRR